MDTIILQGTTSEELVKLINEGVKIQLDEFKKTLQIPNSDEILTRQETCEFLKINSSTLFHWTNKGKLTAIGIGNRRYYKKSELLECLKPLKK